FMVNPIADWGGDHPQYLADARHHPTSNGASDTKPAEIILEGSNTVKEKAEEKQAGHDSTDRPSNEELVSAMPWHIQKPIVLLSYIFGRMSPLAAVILIVSIITGAIYYGQYSRTIWKDRFDAEKAATVQKDKLLIEREKRINKMMGIKGDYAKVSAENSALKADITELTKTNENLKGEISNTLEKHRKDIERLSKRHTIELANYAKNAGLAEAERNGVLQRKINELNQQVTDAKQEKLTLGGQISNLLSSFKSKTASEGKLRASSDRIFKDNQKHLKTIALLRNQVADLGSTASRAADALIATDRYFWSPNGYLETRRACFRRYYISLFANKTIRKHAIEHGIPRDMPSARYSLRRDPSGQLQWCDRYYGG
ncbi:MAG: hypothetical protein HQL53_12470, partial [Magnetococcales bacterium]|nr:hypothetical protein [Magnetococcales bacterium]